jgi:hypothetical protein
MPSIQADVYAGLGLRPDDLAAIRDVRAAYDHTNAMAVAALTALRARLDRHALEDVQAAEPMPIAATPRIGLPKLLNLTDMQSETASLVAALNGFGTRRPRRRACQHVSLSRALAVLSVVGLAAAPLDSDGRLAVAIDKAQRAQRCLWQTAAGSTGRFGSSATPRAGGQDQHAVEPFVGGVIVKMLVICAFLRRATA